MYYSYFCIRSRLPWWLRWLKKKKKSPYCARPGYDSWVWKILWRRKWQIAPIFWPGESQKPTEESGRLQSTGSQKHNWMTNPFTFSTYIIHPCDIYVNTIGYIRYIHIHVMQQEEMLVQHTALSYHFTSLNVSRVRLSQIMSFFCYLFFFLLLYLQLFLPHQHFLTSYNCFPLYYIK